MGTHIGLYFVLMLFGICQATEIKGRNEKNVRLSDFPVIKRWEIPNKIKDSEIGRRHKDVFAEKNIKRSFWEKKPEYNLRELEADEDPEKIYMDLHFSRNMLEEDVGLDDKTSKMINTASLQNTKKSLTEVSRKDNVPLLHQAKRSPLIKKNIRNETNSDTKAKAHKQAEKKRLIALKPFLHSKTKYQRKRKRRNRRSLTDGQVEGLDQIEDTENFQDVLLEDGDKNEDLIEGTSTRVKRSYTPTVADFYFDQYDEQDDEETKENEEVNRVRRAVSGTRSKQIQQINRRGLSGKSIDVKRTIPLHDDIITKIIKNRRIKTNTRFKITDNTKRFTVSADSKMNNKQSDLDTERKTKAIIQKAFFTKNNAVRSENSVRHIIPQSVSKRTIPSVDVKLVSKDLMEHEIGKTPGAKSSSTIPAVKSSSVNVNRQHISHPSSDSINTANVARAVAVAMEQLKRDKMWGKVFVHVRPKGELKVMVQETKKMDDE